MLIIIQFSILEKEPQMEVQKIKTFPSFIHIYIGIYFVMSIHYIVIQLQKQYSK